MFSPHLAVIDPAVRIPELDCYNELSLRSQVKTSYHLPAMFGLDSLKSQENQITSFIILGSSSSVHDRAPWQVELEQWLRPQLELKKPTFGFCYGHQMLAYLFGSRVEYLFPDKRKLQGFRNIRFGRNELWNHQELEGKIYVSHREAVMDCPNSMQIVSTSEEVKIDGLAHRTLPIWSLQSHPESTPIFLKNMGDRHNVDPQAFEFGRKIIDHFLTRIQKS